MLVGKNSEKLISVQHGYSHPRVDRVTRQIPPGHTLNSEIIKWVPDINQNSGFGHAQNSEIIKLILILYFAKIVTESSTLEAHSNNLLVGLSGNLILIDLIFVGGLNPNSSSVAILFLNLNLHFAFVKQITKKIRIKNW